MHLNRCQNHELGWTDGGLRTCRDFSCFRDGVSRFRFFIQKRRWCLFLRWPSLHHARGPCNPATPDLQLAILPQVHPGS